ncbi:MFS transporter [Mycolicibacterium baixiangningiae]|uniref:MFS transporter n=1 Tax=Mycolicibacterium baixiangningiae TaxID=2761578 RepID=UPI0018D1BF4C|nr:MFS transporter [Mycolicibacterium baixiangningiae]
MSTRHKGMTAIRTRFSSTSVTLSAMVVSLSHLIYVPAIPLVQQELGVSAASVAWTIAAFTISQSLAQVLVGPMSDRTDGARLLRIGLVLFLLSNTLILVIPTLTGLMAGRIVTGFGAGMVTGAGYALVAQSASVGKGRERAMAMYQGIIAVGAVAGPSSGSVIVALTGRWEYVFVVLLVASGLALSLSYVFPPPPVELHPPAPHEMWMAARDRGVLVMALASGVVGIVIMTMHSSLSFVLDDAELPTEWLEAVCFAMIPCGVLSGSLLVRHLVQRHEARSLLGIALLWLSGAVVVYGVVQVTTGASPWLFPLLYASGLGLGAGMALSVGVATSLAASTPGTVSAVVVVARNLGTTIAPFIVGLAYDAQRLWLAYLVAVLSLVAVLLVMTVWTRTFRRTAPEAVDAAV